MTCKVSRGTLNRILSSLPAKTLKSTFNGICCYKLAVMLQSISMVQGQM